MANKEESKIIIISVGGSLIVPDELDVGWLGKFKELIDRYVNGGYRFVIIAGGGRTARKYQEAAKKLIELKSEDIDWIGIHSTRLNAYLLKAIFHDKSKYNIIKDPVEEIDFREKILIAAGWKPGCSTDYAAVMLANNLGIKRLINLTNIDYVYDRDPKKFSNAIKIEKISWKDFRNIVGNKWSPGLNAPFDPIASKDAEKLEMKVIIINGKNLVNLEACLAGKKFKGTIIW